MAWPGAQRAAWAAASVPEQEAYDIGVDAYLFLYPLVTMEITRAQLTNVEPEKPPTRASMDAFGHLRTFPPIPPVSAFWSITLYDSEGYAVSNALDRFSIGDRDGLVSNADGSLEIIVAAADPDPASDRKSNWLPAPMRPFNLTMSLYGPQRSMLDGTWLPPPVRRLP